MILVLDANALYWFCEQSRKLPSRVRRAIENEENEIIIPVIVLAEMQQQFETRAFRESANAYVTTLRGTREVQLAVLDATLVYEKPGGLELHDSLIASLVMRLAKQNPNDAVRLVSSDTRLAALGIPLLWD